VNVDRPRTPLALVVLSLVAEGPVHPYRMQQKIKERGKDQVANVARPNSVYQTIDSLRRAGLIAVQGTSRDERRPERTVYEITEEGRRTFQRWMRAVLATPERSFPDFPAALSLLALMEPEDVRHRLEARAEALASRLRQLEAPTGDLPRLFLLEDEYRRAVLRAELDWVRSVVDDLAAGRLTWSEEWVRSVAERLGQLG
jgi:DNA-binding PadR family transcriptional regulator